MCRWVSMDEQNPKTTDLKQAVQSVLPALAYLCRSIYALIGCVLETRFLSQLTNFSAQVSQVEEAKSRKVLFVIQ